MCRRVGRCLNRGDRFIECWFNRIWSGDRLGSESGPNEGKRFREEDGDKRGERAGEEVSTKRAGRGDNRQKTKGRHGFQERSNQNVLKMDKQQIFTRLRKVKTHQDDSSRDTPGMLPASNKGQYSNCMPPSITAGSHVTSNLSRQQLDIGSRLRNVLQRGAVETVSQRSLWID